MKELVIRAMNGDIDAFESLIRTNRDTLYRTGRSYLNNDEDIADAVQETILICFEKLRDLKFPQFFKTWMVRIMINQCKQIIRKRKVYEDVENVKESELQEHFTQSGFSGTGKTTAESRVCFQDMINSLDVIYRPAVSLYYGENLSIREISEILEISEDAVKKRLSRARAALKNDYFAYLEMN